MAKLDDVINSLNKKLTFDKKIPSIVERESSKSYKCRPWLVNEEDSDIDDNLKGVYRPFLDKGFINPIDQPDLSALLNRVDQSLLDKGSIKGVYKPLKEKGVYRPHI